MGEELDNQTKLNIYRVVLKRYSSLINDKESISITQIRQKVSPYNDFIRQRKEDITQIFYTYDPKNDFLPAVQRAISYIRSIKTCEFAFTFWMDFSDMHSLKIGTAMDKAILFAAILRSLGSEDVRVLVTKKGKHYVKFTGPERNYLFVPKTGSLLTGEDSQNLFRDDPISYSFSDLVYENHLDE